MHRFEAQCESPSAPRRGIALAVAVTALALLGLLVAGLAVGVRRDIRGARDALLRAQTLALADEGLTVALRTALPANDSLAAAGLLRVMVLGGGDARDTVRVWKVGSSTYALVSEAVRRRGARRVRRRLILLATAVRDSAYASPATPAADTVPPAVPRVLRPLALRGWSELP